MPVLATDHDLATTYNTVNEIGPWARVQEYHRVKAYTARNPSQASTAVASALNLPRGRIRSWVDADGMPDPVRGIDRARSRGWLDLDADSEAGRPWVQLTAWIYSGGSITTDTHHPTFYVREHQHGLDRNELDVLRTALDEIGTGYQLVDRDHTRATHIQPADDAVLVGRLLAAMGAPTGDKAPHADLELPSWLWESAVETQRAFCRIYLLNRATAREHEPRFQFREERSDKYHDEVVELFAQATGRPDGISRSGHNTFLRSEVVDSLLADTDA